MNIENFERRIFKTLKSPSSLQEAARTHKNIENFKSRTFRAIELFCFRCEKFVKNNRSSGGCQNWYRTPDFQKIFFTRTNLENFEQGIFKAIELFRFRFQCESCSG